MSVFKRPGSPFYYSEVDLRSAGGPRSIRSTKTASRREAEAFDRDHRKELKAELGKPVKAPLSLDQACGKYWLDHGSKLRWSAQVEWHLRRITTHIEPSMALADLSNADVDSLVQKRKAEGAGDVAVNRTLAVLRSVHRRAQRRWDIEVRSISWSEYMTRETVGRTRWLTPAEAARLIECLPEHIRLAVEWSLYTGCRRSETYGLLWEKVDLERGEAVVIAKGGKEKIVFLSAEARAVLARCPHHGPRVFDPTNGRKIFDAALKKAKIGEFTWHDLRHTHATWLRQAGAALEIVQRSLGHAKITTTQRYAHVDDQEVRDALRKLPTLTTNTTNVFKLKR